MSVVRYIYKCSTDKWTDKCTYFYSDENSYCGLLKDTPWSDICTNILEEYSILKMEAVYLWKSDYHLPEYMVLPPLERIQKYKYKSLNSLVSQYLCRFGWLAFHPT
jgi:hypothetical protein